MPPATTRSRSLSTADERREAVLEAGMKVFAARGIHGTPTTEVAKAAGISHAYLFRLYPTKSDLAVAIVTRCFERIYTAFAAAAAQAAKTGEDPLSAMGGAYKELLTDRDLLCVQLHAQAAAAGDDAIGDAVRASFQSLHHLVAERSGADDVRIGGFFATGMLCNVIAAIGAEDVDAPWARALCTLGKSDD